MFLVFFTPNFIGSVLALNFESPLTSSVSFIISRIKLVKKANKEYATQPKIFVFSSNGINIKMVEAVITATNRLPNK